MIELFKRKYFLALMIAVLAIIGLLFKGVWTWLLPMYAFILVPLVELILPPLSTNHNESEEQELLDNKIFDWIAYAIVPIHWGLLVLFLFSMKQDLLWWERGGRIFTFGICCGIYGINVAHELGHRVKRSERMMSKALLLSSQYMHFFIEHNKGHHKYVSTPEDPASSRYNEWVYVFWIRSIIMGYRSAWKIQLKELKRTKAGIISMKNEMLLYLIFQSLLILLIAFVFSWSIAGFYLISAFIGILLLETVNYIEHYGLLRNRSNSGQFIAVKPIHSWNSDHRLGRGMLFELSRHSDHHYKASRKYQILRSFEDSPQMPTGYPGMIVLSLLSPLWFLVMNSRVKKLKADYPEWLA
jgi:alkane 1-monooxygenase